MDLDNDLSGARLGDGDIADLGLALGGNDDDFGHCIGVSKWDRVRRRRERDEADLLVSGSLTETTPPLPRSALDGRRARSAWTPAAQTARQGHPTSRAKRHRLRNPLHQFQRRTTPPCSTRRPSSRQNSAAARERLPDCASSSATAAGCVDGVSSLVSSSSFCHEETHSNLLCAQWLHRATWTQTELFLTFPPSPDSSTGLSSISLVPRNAPETGGRFRVWLLRHAAQRDAQGKEKAKWRGWELVWDRKIEGGFPEMKELVRRFLFSSPKRC